MHKGVRHPTKCYIIIKLFQTYTVAHFDVTKMHPIRRRIKKASALECCSTDVSEFESITRSQTALTIYAIFT